MNFTTVRITIIIDILRLGSFQPLFLFLSHKHDEVLESTTGVLMSSSSIGLFYVAATCFTVKSMRLFRFLLVELVPNTVVTMLVRAAACVEVLRTVLHVELRLSERFYDGLAHEQGRVED